MPSPSRRTLLGVVVATTFACQSPPRIESEIAPPGATSLDTFAQSVEDLVHVGDTDGLSALWLTEREIEACRLATPEPRRPADIVQEHARGFEKPAGDLMGEAHRGEVIFTNRHATKRPKFGASHLVGERCPATKWGRVNVIVVPREAPDEVIEHRFNALLVEDGWRLYRYLPNRPDCSKAAGRRHMGCKKWLELQAGSAEG